VQQTTVAHIDLGGFDLTLLQVFVPWLQDTQDIGAIKNIQVITYGVGSHIHGASKFCRIPNLAVVVRGHQPETAQCLGRAPNAN
jgi:hypothetical protein